MKSKALEQHKDASLYNVIATNRITGKISVFERNLTYIEVMNLDAEGYVKANKRYRDFRLQRVEIDPAKVAKKIGKTVCHGKCQQCKAEFNGIDASKQVRKHVATYHHTVNLTTYLETQYSPKKNR